MSDIEDKLETLGHNMKFLYNNLIKSGIHPEIKNGYYRSLRDLKHEIQIIFEFQIEDFP